MNEERGRTMFRVLFQNRNVGLWLAVLVLAGAVAVPLRAAETAGPKASSGDEFFIISSLDLKKNQLVLKRPTEVTVLMAVNEKTVCLDEKGKAIHLKDLRAGDTVFVSSRPSNDGTLAATRIRKGYMTLQEVHSRYITE
jgi:hypothetical protein